MTQDQSLRHAAHKFNLILVDRVPHARIQALGHVSAQAAQHFRSLLDAFLRNVWIDITAA